MILPRIGRPLKAEGRPDDCGPGFRDFPQTCGLNHPREMTAAEACVSAAPLAFAFPAVRPSAVRRPSLHPGRPPLRCCQSDGQPARPPARPPSGVATVSSAYAGAAVGAYVASPASS